MGDKEEVPLLIRARQKAAAKKSAAALKAPSPSIPTNHSLQNTPPPSPLSPPLPLSNPEVLFMADKEKLPLHIRAHIHSACALAAKRSAAAFTAAGEIDPQLSPHWSMEKLLESLSEIQNPFHAMIERLAAQHGITYQQVQQVIIEWFEYTRSSMRTCTEEVHNDQKSVSTRGTRKESVDAGTQDVRDASASNIEDKRID